MSALVSSGKKTYGTFNTEAPPSYSVRPMTPGSEDGTVSTSPTVDKFEKSQDRSGIDWRNSPEVPTNAKERVDYYMAHMPLTDPDTTAAIKAKITRMETSLADIRGKQLKKDFAY